MAKARRPARLKLDPGMLLSAAAGLLLFFLLFQGWFGLESAASVSDDAVGVGMERSFDAWMSFAWIDLFLLAVAVAAVAIVIMAVSRVRLPIRPGPWMVVLGAIAFAFVAYRIVVPPWDGAEREAAPFLALLCCAAIAGGGHLSQRLSSAERTASAGAARKVRPAGR